MHGSHAAKFKRLSTKRSIANNDEILRPDAAFHRRDAEHLTCWNNLCWTTSGAAARATQSSKFRPLPPIIILPTNRPTTSGGNNNNNPFQDMSLPIGSVVPSLISNIPLARSSVTPTNAPSLSSTPTPSSASSSKSSAPSSYKAQSESLTSFSGLLNAIPTSLTDTLLASDTTTAIGSTSLSSSSSLNSSNSVPLAGIVGGVVGAVTFILTILIIIIFLRRRASRRLDATQNDHSHLMGPSYPTPNMTQVSTVDMTGTSATAPSPPPSPLVSSSMPPTSYNPASFAPEMYESSSRSIRTSIAESEIAYLQAMMQPPETPNAVRSLPAFPPTAYSPSSPETVYSPQEQEVQDRLMDMQAHVTRSIAELRSRMAEVQFLRLRATEHDPEAERSEDTQLEMEERQLLQLQAQIRRELGRDRQNSTVAPSSGRRSLITIRSSQQTAPPAYTYMGNLRHSVDSTYTTSVEG